MKNRLKILFLGVLAGLAIGLGSFINVLMLSLKQKELGSLFFGIGLLLVCLFSLYLYTGKIGFVTNSKNKGSYIIDLIIGIIGNFIGAAGLGYLLGLIDNQDLVAAAKSAASGKLVDIGQGGTPFYITLILSFLFGVGVYIVVYCFKKDWPLHIKIIILFVTIFACVYSGFEHCIANTYYFSMANMWKGESFLDIALCIIGNSVGSITFNLMITKVTK